MNELIQRILPILLLIVIGIISRQTKLLTNQGVEALKNIIIKIALPVILFKSFATMTLEVSYLMLFILTFLFCSILYGVGALLHRLLPRFFKRSFTGGYFTGFEFGMIGVGLFSAIWGLENLPVIMLIGFGHELFIWFLYVPVISFKGEGTFDMGNTLRAFIRTPTIVGIIFGITFNILQVYDKVGMTMLGSSLYVTIDFLAPLTAPLILIIIGYSMSFGRLNLKEAFLYITSRWVAVLGLGIPLLFLIHTLVPGLPSLFTQAYFAFILLPAPYILPLFIKDEEESEFFSQLLVYSTLTSFIGYVILLAVSL